MKGLKAQDYHGKQVVDSRDVAEMVEKRHGDLLRDIHGYVEIMKNSNERNFAPVDFFIPSTYIDSKGQSRPNYLITKKGCDMIANKLTGKKGVLFTAAYVTAFEEMREALTVQKRAALPEGVTLSSVVGFLRIARRAMLDMGCSPVDVGAMICQTCEAVNFPTPPALVKQIPGQLCLFDNPTNVLTE